jgi:hypothetical protein
MKEPMQPPPNPVIASRPQGGVAIQAESQAERPPGSLRCARDDDPAVPTYHRAQPEPMSAVNKVTIAKLIDGKVFIRQADGTWREAEDRTDWRRVDSFTDEDIERQAEKDGDAEWFPDDLKPACTIRPYQPAD